MSTMVAKIEYVRHGICHHEFKLEAKNNDWMKKEAKMDIQNKLCDYLDNTLAGSDSTIVVKRHQYLQLCNFLGN